jgi:3-hydroxybutyryl-CoA dehydrogenase
LWGRAGAHVTLHSRSEATLADARAALADEGEEAPRTTADLAEAVAAADLVLESIPEDAARKRELLTRVEAAAPPGAVLGTNTSSLPLDGLASALARPERFLGLHWFNPAHLVPLVEVVPATATDAAVVDWSAGILREAGKRPRVLRRAVAGFIANRLQYALIREALQLLEDGVADAETIDACLTDCLGPRWAVIGPLRSTDLAGVETAVAVAEQLYPELAAGTAPPRVLLELREQGRLGVRSGQGFHRYPDPAAAGAARDRGLRAVLDALARLDGQPE